MNRIMIVDDYPPVLRVMRLGLEEAGYDVDAASNGTECLLKLCDGLPDFLVTDTDMPRMSGKELCAAIEKQFPHRTFPIMVLTSRTEVEHRDWTHAIPKLSLMEKPVSVRRLVSFIGRSLAADELAVGS